MTADDAGERPVSEAFVIDLRQIVVTFGAVFVAELGDKTQLATFGFAAESRSPLSVFLGSALALVTTSLLAVVAGGLVGRFVSATVLQRASGVLFVVLGAWTLWSSFRAGPG
jgi:putative Ca2+/H+ antiporter (TMEM165/GDT1 family)